MKSGYWNLSIRAAQALQRLRAKFGVMLGAIFLAELTMMLVDDWLQLETTGWAAALIDTAILTAAASIIMWPLIIKPLHVALEADNYRQALRRADSRTYVLTEKDSRSLCLP